MATLLAPSGALPSVGEAISNSADARSINFLARGLERIARNTGKI
jgi:hypothetical protein